MWIDELGFSMYPADAFVSLGGRMRLYGGKGGSNAPAPDPRLTAAQIKSMGIQDDAIAEVLNNSREMAPLQKEQTRLGIERGAQLYNQGQEDRTYALGRRGILTTQQDQMVKDAAEFNTEDKREQLAGTARADVTQAYDTARGVQQRNLERSGVNPSSGKAVAMDNETSLALAKTMAGAGTGARAAARAEGRTLTDRASNALSGYPSLSAGSVGTGAGVAGFGLNAANAGAAGVNSGYGVAGSMAGQLGANATGAYGAQAGYKNQQDQIAANNDPFKTILGAAAGVGTKMLLA